MILSPARLTFLALLAAAPAATSGMYAFAVSPPSRGLPFYYYTPVIEAPPSPLELWQNALADQLRAKSTASNELASIVRHLSRLPSLWSDEEQPASTIGGEEARRVPGRWTEDGDGKRVSTTVAFHQPVTLNEVSAQVTIEQSLVHIRSKHKLSNGMSTTSTQLKLPFAVSRPEDITLELAADGKSVTLSVRRAFKVKPLEPSDLSITAAASTASIVGPSPSPAADLVDAAIAKAEEGASSLEAQDAADVEAELERKFSFAEGSAAVAATKQPPPPDAPGVGFEFEAAGEPMDGK